MLKTSFNPVPVWVCGKPSTLQHLNSPGLFNFVFHSRSLNPARHFSEKIVIQDIHTYTYTYIFFIYIYIFNVCSSLWRKVYY